MKRGLLAKAFRAGAHRFAQVYDCRYPAQDGPGGHYQEFAPVRGSGLALGLATSASAGGLFLTTGAHDRSYDPWPRRANA